MSKGTGNPRHWPGWFRLVGSRATLGKFQPRREAASAARDVFTRDLNFASDGKS